MYLKNVDLKLDLYFYLPGDNELTHWGRVTHICVSKLTIIGSDNGLSPGRRQAIIWTNAGILLIGPLGTNFSEILIGIQTFPFKKLRLRMSSAKWRPSCLGLNELKWTLSIFQCDQPVSVDFLWCMWSNWTFLWSYGVNASLRTRVTLLATKKVEYIAKMVSIKYIWSLALTPNYFCGEKYQTHPSKSGVELTVLFRNKWLKLFWFVWRVLV